MNGTNSNIVNITTQNGGYNASFRWVSRVERPACFGDIDGSNTVDVGGNSLTGPGGIFAQTTNMGTYKRDKIAYVPEITFNVNRRLTERLDFTVGYSFMYWSSVVLAGDQIDTTVDGGLFNSGPGNGVNRPSFTFRETDFFMHSLSLGMNFRF